MFYLIGYLIIGLFSFLWFYHRTAFLASLDENDLPLPPDATDEMRDMGRNIVLRSKLAYEELQNNSWVYFKWFAWLTFLWPVAWISAFLFQK